MLGLESTEGGSFIEPNGVTRSSGALRDVEPVAGDTGAKLLRLPTTPDVAALCEVAGVFNLDPGGRTDRRYGITRRLADLGYVSAYHAFHKVAPGTEQPTHFHQFKPDKPFHIDMVFVPTDLVGAIRSVEIAPFDGWVTPGATRSDHVPVTLDLDLDLE